MMIEVNDNIKDIANKILDLYRNELKNKNINASSHLSNSATTDVRIEGNHLRIYFNLEDYWKYVENGRGPGKQPPISAIEKWIRIKPIIPNPINGKVPSNKQLAFMIGRKIGRDGIPGKFPLQNVVKSNIVDDLVQGIKNELVKQLNDMLKGE